MNFLIKKNTQHDRQKCKRFDSPEANASSCLLLIASSSHQRKGTHRFIVVVFWLCLPRLSCVSTSSSDQRNTAMNSPPLSSLYRKWYLGYWVIICFMFYVHALTCCFFVGRRRLSSRLVRPPLMTQIQYCIKGNSGVQSPESIMSE